MDTDSTPILWHSVTSGLGRMLKDPDLMRGRYLRNGGSEEDWPSFFARETGNYSTLLLTESHAFLDGAERWKWIEEFIIDPEGHRAKLGAVSDDEWSQFLDHHRAVYDMCMSIKNGL